MVKYSGDRKSASLTMKTRVNPKYSSAELKYFFNETEQSSPDFSASAPSGLLKIRVEAWNDGSKIATLSIDDLDFIWNHPEVQQPDNFKNGQKGAIV